jgi:hypothetical protein
MGFVTWANANNGDIPLWKMVDLTGNQDFLNPAAAAFFWAWDADFYSLTGTHITISEAFRNITKQEYYANAYAAYQRYRNGGPWAPVAYPAAIPHTSSHGMGLAVDVNSWVYGSDEHKHDLLVDSGMRHGWSWYEVGKPSGEPWHFNFTGDPTLISVQDYLNKFKAVNPAMTDEEFQRIQVIVHEQMVSILRAPEFNGFTQPQKDYIQVTSHEQMLDVVRSPEFTNIVKGAK